MPTGRWERRRHPADERLHRAAQNEGNSARKLCVCVFMCVYILRSKAFPNGACLEALLRITGAAAAVYFTDLILRRHHSGFMRVSHTLVWFPTCSFLE